MADIKTKNQNMTISEAQTAEERAEAIRREADRIASQILTLTRNGLFVSLRFLDLALCQFEYINTDKIKGISTTGKHIVYNSQYVIENYMKDRQALSRDYLHMVLHCVFRHPFVSEKLNEEYWNLATDIAVETIIDELDLKQTATNSCDEVSKEVARIKKMMHRVTAEHIYQLLLSGGVPQKDIDRWQKLFYRDDHRVWWDIAKQIAEELRKRQEEEAKKDEPPESGREKDAAPKIDEESEEGESSEDEETENQEDSEGSEGEGSEDGENAEDGDSSEQGEEDAGGEEGSEEDSEESGEEGEEGSEEGEQPEEEQEDFDQYEEEYSSTPGESMERENPDDLADPDSDTQESGNESDGEGSGGGKPDENDPQQSDQEGDSRKNDQTGEGLEGQDDHHKPEGKNNTAGSLDGTTDEGKRDDSQNDPFSDQEKQSGTGALSEGGNTSRGSGQENGQQHSAGTGGGGDGSQSAWEHESGGANRRAGGEKNEENRSRLSGDADPNSEKENSSGDLRPEEAIPTEASNQEDGGDEDKAPSYMHGESEQEKLKDKWKDLSERILVDLQTSSKEWGEKSDTMLQGVKKINRDKYDYTTFLRKFATMREDIQINPEEFDYVYYTFGMERYGNIPLIEPLEYKEVKKVRDFVIAIDTSGSCAGEVVQKFLDKTYSLFTQQENFFKKINLHIIQCDAQIQSDVKITSKTEFDDYVRDLEFKGFGGTDFRPVFEYVNQLIEQKEFDDLKGLIYFTDGNGTYPKKRPPYETAFVFVDDDEFEYEVPSWAMKLVLETSDIMEEVLI